MDMYVIVAKCVYEYNEWMNTVDTICIWIDTYVNWTQQL